tara:strand:+ start:100 stop:915 length:816 start_codon:yes stop_codon:yes gene_type:complete
MVSCRCQFIVFDNNTKRNRLCKNKKKFFNFCFIHAPIKNVILIQSYFKAHLVRKKLFYYKQLPCDLQKKIIWYMRKDLYIKSFNNSIIKIIYNKLKKFLNSVNITNTLDVNSNNLSYNHEYEYGWQYRYLFPVKDGNAYQILKKAEMNTNEIIYEIYQWHDPSGDFKYQNGYEHPLLIELNNIVKLLNKYSLIINTLDKFHKINNLINQILYIVAFIIKKNQNSSLFNKMPEEYNEFSKIYLKDWLTRQYFLNLNVLSMFEHHYNDNYFLS